MEEASTPGEVERILSHSGRTGDGRHEIRATRLSKRGSAKEVNRGIVAVAGTINTISLKARSCVRRTNSFARERWKGGKDKAVMCKVRKKAIEEGEARGYKGASRKLWLEVWSDEEERFDILVWQPL